MWNEVKEEAGSDGVAVNLQDRLWVGPWVLGQEEPTRSRQGAGAPATLLPTRPEASEHGATQSQGLGQVPERCVPYSSTQGSHKADREPRSTEWETEAQ